MLVLQSHRNGKVRMTVPPSTEPRDITLIVTDVSGGKVWFGFDADRDVEILRNDAIRTTSRIVHQDDHDTKGAAT